MPPSRFVLSLFRLARVLLGDRSRACSPRSGRLPGFCMAADRQSVPPAAPCCSGPSPFPLVSLTLTCFPLFRRTRRDQEGATVPTDLLNSSGAAVGIGATLVSSRDSDKTDALAAFVANKFSRRDAADAAWLAQTFPAILLATAQAPEVRQPTGMRCYALYPCRRQDSTLSPGNGVQQTDSGLHKAAVDIYQVVAGDVAGNSASVKARLPDIALGSSFHQVSPQSQPSLHPVARILPCWTLLLAPSSTLLHRRTPAPCPGHRKATLTKAITARSLQGFDA